MKRNAFGQLGTAPAAPYHRPFLRYFAPVDGEGGGGGDGKEFKAPASQEELDRIVTDRVSRAERKARDEERAKFADYEEVKADAEKFRAANAAKPDPKPGDKPAGVTETDVDKRINDALAAERLELALERVADRLDKALEGRTYSASKLFGLDRKQFVAQDGKSVDEKAITEWVKDNSTEIEKSDPKRKPIPGQGERGETTPGIESGKAAYEKRHPKKN